MYDSQEKLPDTQIVGFLETQSARRSQLSTVTNQCQQPRLVQAGFVAMSLVGKWQHNRGAFGQSQRSPATRAHAIARNSVSNTCAPHEQNCVLPEIA